jgi:hypothetical protein
MLSLFINNINSVICRVTINNDVLNIDVRLLQYTTNATLNVFLPVKNGSNNSYLGAIFILRFTLVENYVGY